MSSVLTFLQNTKFLFCFIFWTPKIRPANKLCRRKKKRQRTILQANERPGHQLKGLGMRRAGQMIHRLAVPEVSHKDKKSFSLPETKHKLLTEGERSQDVTFVLVFEITLRTEKTAQLCGGCCILRISTKTPSLSG